jgi:signal peptidase II
MNDRSVKGFYIFSIIMILFDHATKLYFKGFNLLGIEHQGYEWGQSTEVIGEYLRWTYVENPGMAFGIEFGPFKILLSLFSIVAAGGLVWLIGKLRNYNFWVKFGFAFILAGAVGNMIDRVFYGVFYGTHPLFYGWVVDFIQVDIPDIGSWTHFPIFNIADSCVTVGVSILIIMHNKLPDFEDIVPWGKKKKAESEEQPEETEATGNDGA